MPYQLRGAERFFDRPEVRKAGAALRAAARFGANDSLLDDAVDLPSQVRAVLSGEGWTTNPRPDPAPSESARESLAALVHLAQDFAAAKQGATLGDLVAELDERASAQHAPTVQGVTLASLHSAKGLEWDVVFLVGVAEGMMPITYAKTDEQESRKNADSSTSESPAQTPPRLLGPVPLTGGRPNRRPSRFLDGLRPGSSPPRAAAPAAAQEASSARASEDSGGTIVRRTSRTPARCGSAGAR